MTQVRVTAKQAARKATEAALLASATEMLLGSPTSEVFGSLRPVEVARRARPPRTTGAFYNIWPTRAEFHAALLDHLLSLDRFRITDETLATLRQQLDEPDFDLAEAFRVATTTTVDRLEHEPAMRLKHALWTHANDPDVRAQVGELYSAVAQRVAPVYAAVLARSGRRLRPPFTVETLGTVVTALAEGLHIRWAVQPEAVPDDAGAPPGVEPDPERPWGLLALVTYVLLVAVTEPADPFGAPTRP